MQPGDTMDLVVRDGVRFLESLTRHYGPEEGLRIWEGIGEVVGTDVKGKIFFNMLTGGSPTRVGFVTPDDSLGYAVPIIKAIRGSTGMGLKEAKDAYDVSRIKRTYVECSDNEAARTLEYALRGFGCHV